MCKVNKELEELKEISILNDIPNEYQEYDTYSTYQEYDFNANAYMPKKEYQYQYQLIEDINKSNSQFKSIYN